MTKSKIFLYLCLSFIGGIFWSSFFYPLNFRGFLIFGIILISVFWRNKKIMAAGFCVLVFAFGILRYDSIISDYELSPRQNLGKIALEGIVAREPSRGLNNMKLTITPTLILPSLFASKQSAEIRGINAEHAEFFCDRLRKVCESPRFGLTPKEEGEEAGEGLSSEALAEEDRFNNILVTTNLYPEYQYGDLLEITGGLEEPKIFPDFNYKGYLAKEGITFVMYNPKIALIKHDALCENQITNISRINREYSHEYSLEYDGLKTSFKNTPPCYKYKLYKTLLNIKNRLENNIDKFISSPQSGILNAIIWGDEQGISDNLKNKLNITGTRHIVAVSGMNITIIGGILFSFLIAIGFWRRQAFFFSIIILILFILMIGAPASAVRAGIMGGILIFAQIFSRISNVSRTVIFAGAAMLAQNPLLLKYDIGFQLSFAAVLGIIYLKPIFDKWFSKIPKNFGFRDILSMTLSAQLAAFPILIYNFGQISIISPLANILIVSLLPFVTVAGFFTASAGIIWQNFGQVLSWPLWLVLAYIVKIIDWFSLVPFASLSIGKGSWILVVGYYGVLIWLIRRWQKRNRTTAEMR